jgi:thiamine-phosphate pyrophosphorylase
VTDARLAKLSGIYAIADDDPRWPAGPRDVVSGALAGGATVIQLRHKHASDREVLALAEWAASECRRSGALCFVNDRFDLADLAGADGVHLGDEDLAPERIPADVRSRLLVGLSTHTLEQVRASRERPIDYVAFGPIFGTTSKDSKWPPRGVDALREAVRLARHPLVAIGGIDAANAASVAAAGAPAAAVISAVANTRDPAGAVRRLAERFRAGSRGEGEWSASSG